ncbi:MAG: chorismate-binding protein, partial [Myxococcota bacterium]
VESTPIKGTRRRGASLADDARLRSELRDAAKDRAELVMIVDLVRNDLGRVAVVGSVVAGDRVITAHPTVFHAAWPVRAELLPGRDAWDALAATFPPGSVTGAPKVRACQRIAALEPHPRGVYCGAIGYAADGGDARFSVAIRTGVFDGPDARYHVGGGIVVDSDPAAEWDETVAKELALRRALVG